MMRSYQKNLPRCALDILEHGINKLSTELRPNFSFVYGLSQQLVEISIVFLTFLRTFFAPFTPTYLIRIVAILAFSVAILAFPVNVLLEKFFDW